MSIQFRSRVKSVKDFGSDLKQVGTCCFVDGTSSQITFYECFTQDGTFIVGENVVCPEKNTIGNCFACSYLTAEQKIQVAENPDILNENPTWGKSTVTECECSRIGGVFNETNPLNIYGLDARIPQSCCYFAYDENDFPLGITCANVCSEKECSLKGITFPNGSLVNTPVYDALNTCLESSCSTSGFTDFLYKQMAIGTASTTTEDVGVCYTLTKNTAGFSYDCGFSIEEDCVGYWISPDTEESGFVFCGSAYAPNTPTIESNRKIEPESMTEIEFDSLGLTAGDTFHGGIFIGKFSPNSSSHKVYGSLNFSPAEEKYYSENSPKGEYSKWALIVDTRDYYVKYLTKEEQYSTIPNASLSDGFYNCYGDKTNFFGYSTALLNTIVGQIRNGFADYYVPSIIELYYLANAIRKSTSLRTTLDIKNNLYSSSFFYENIITNNTNEYRFNGHVFVYGQNFSNSSNFGKTVLVPSNTRSYMRLFRKVILT